MSYKTYTYMYLGYTVPVTPPCVLTIVEVSSYTVRLIYNCHATISMHMIMQAMEKQLVQLGEQLVLAGLAGMPACTCTWQCSNYRLG